MRNWTPYKSKTITSIDVLDPVHKIKGELYRHSEIVDIYEYWRGILEMGQIRRGVVDALVRIDDEDNSILEFYTLNSEQLNKRWYDKLKEWKQEQADLMAAEHATLIDFIARDLKREYEQARADGFQTWKELEAEKARLKEEAKYGPPPKDVFEYLRYQEILHGDDVDETAETSWFGEW